jgi:hypothetical protein
MRNLALPNMNSSSRDENAEVTGRSSAGFIIEHVVLTAAQIAMKKMMKEWPLMDVE